ncbi:MAG: hypothetical protein RLZ98_1685 [Pseudomonadota bacterium]
MASRQFRAVERNLSRIYFLELMEKLQEEQFQTDAQKTFAAPPPASPRAKPAIGTTLDRHFPPIDVNLSA